jgi:hypothetical protein
MQAVESAVTQKGCCRNIAITLIDRVVSAIACLHQLPLNPSLERFGLNCRWTEHFEGATYQGSSPELRVPVKSCKYA